MIPAMMNGTFRGAAPPSILCFLLAGCGAGASVEGSVGGFSFELATVYAWIDATEADVDQDAGKIVFSEREDHDLHLVLSGASYDPEVDVRFMSADELIAVSLDEERYGRIGMVVTESQGIANGTVLTDPPATDGGPRLNASHRFGAVRVEADAEYPPEALLLASRVTYTLTIDEIEREAGKYVSGTIVVAIDRADDDPAGLQTGSITVDFSAKLIGERIAECNHGQDQSRSCELILP
jgi:hypothetical protein